VRDLGIFVDANMSFKAHINVIVAKAHLRANRIICCFLSRDIESLTRAFVTYVRPLVEYCSQVWSPCTIGQIKRLESVQTVFTKKLPGMFQMNGIKPLLRLYTKKDLVRIVLITGLSL